MTPPQRLRRCHRNILSCSCSCSRYDVPGTDDADADTDDYDEADTDDAGPCEDIVVLAKIHNSPREDILSSIPGENT